MNAAARVRREKVRMQAAAMFEESEPSRQIAAELRVSPKSVREWRRRWVAGGTEALASSGLGGSDCELSGEQLGELADLLDRGRLSRAGPTPAGLWRGSPT
jgi:transposase